jgi:hypothetical protein
MVRIAEALGIAPEPGQTASALADRCVERAEELRDLAEANMHEAEAEQAAPATPAAPAAKGTPNSKRERSAKGSRKSSRRQAEAS